MEQVTVKKLASEFDLKSSLVISELKKIGVWVPSAATLVDTDIANRIRKRLQMIVEAELDEKEKKAEKTKRAPASKVRRSIKELGKPRKRVARRKAGEEEQKEVASPSPLAHSLKPRKGRKAAYRKVEAEQPEEVIEKIEVTIEDEPLIEAVEATVSPEVIEGQPQEDVLAQAVEAVEEEPVEAAEPQQVVAEAKAAEEAVSEEEISVTVTPEEAVPSPEVEETQAEARAVEEALPEEAKEEVEPTPEAVEETVAAVEAATLEEAEAEPAPKKVKRAVAKKKSRKAKAKAKAAAEVPEEAEGEREVVFSEKVTVKYFSEKTGVRSNEVIRALMEQGMMATVNQSLDQETVEALCERFEVYAQFVSFEEAAAIEDQGVDRPEDLVGRAPVVTVMGHVDHGKTSLLDYIRNAQVAEGEAGGITQHIGAYHVETSGQKIVFIDTPGHEAFTRMRARGAQATDIVVLVVAADDGVMPQTLEAIDHARAAEVPIIVAINKIDKPGAQPDRVKKELSDRGLVAEDWGGDTVVVPVSAIEGTNVDLLLEMILLVTELREFKANPSRAASGVILEAKMEKGRGAVATLLLQNGTLRIGDIFIAGSTYGRVRAMFDDTGDALQEVGPSSAVAILGLQGIPLAGDVFQVVEGQTKAREMVEFRLEKAREREMAGPARVSLDDLYAQMQAGEVKELPIVLKADTQGSVEVLEETLNKLTTQKVRIEVILKGVGAITESDVLLASASNAIVIGFNVRPEANAKVASEHENVEIRLYNVIYDVASEIEQAMVGLLEPTIKERYLGRAEVRDTFKVPKVGIVAGCHVQDGTINRNSELRLIRDNVLVYEGKVGSLRRFKEDVNEVKSGYECGISITNFNDVKVGDVIESFVKEEVAPQLN